MSSRRRGAFIVIEGLDRSGKSTQAALLRDRLLPAVKLLKFPDRTTPIGHMLDSYLRTQTELDDRAVHLLFSANRWELADIIRTALHAGTTVLCDRYAFSGLAFTCAKQQQQQPPTADALPASLYTYEWCRAPDAGLPAPDLTLFLDVSPDVARQRGGYGTERYEREDMQRRVRDVFARIARDVGPERWVTIDASRDMDAVRDEIWDRVQHLAEGVNNSEAAGTLWTD